MRARIGADFDAAFAEVDVLLTPVTPTTAPRRGAAATPLEMYQGDLYTLPASLAGVPGLSVPVGRDPGGLPVGVQLLGRAFDEATVVRAGAAVERALGRLPLPG
ncbi:MAG: amidase family protein [Kofleriaceae bacterium]